MSILAEIAFQVLAWLWQVLFLTRFFAVLSVVTVMAMVGDYYLRQGSVWREFGWPLVVGGVVVGLIWEIVAWNDGKKHSLS